MTEIEILDIRKSTWIDRLEHLSFIDNWHVTILLDGKRKSFTIFAEYPYNLWLEKYIIRKALTGKQWMPPEFEYEIVKLVGKKIEL